MSEDEDLRWRRITDALAAEIAAGIHVAGDRLPSVRRLMARHHVSLTTAARALIELEGRGLAVARPRSGFYVAEAAARPARPAATRSAPPGPAAVNALITEIFRAHPAASPLRLPLGAAELDETLLPHRDLAAALARAARSAGAGLLAYGHRAGDLALRRRIARRMSQRGVTVDPEEVRITAGETDAMGSALRALTRPGDIVAVESPCFFGILQWLEILGLQALEVATDPHTGVDLDELARLADQMPIAALVLAPTFHNPFGFAMPAERMERLAAFAAERRLPIVEDDVYGELHHGRDARRPLKAFDRDDGIVYCSSFSKTLAPGFRVGWCLPGRHGEALDRVWAARTVGPATPSQAALAAYLDGRAYERHLARLRTLFAAQVAPIRALVLDAFPAGTRISEPRGGYVFWVEVPPPFDALDFHDRARRAGISIAPGPIFSASGSFRHAFRLSVGRRLNAEVEVGIRRLGAIARGDDGVGYVELRDPTSVKAAPPDRH